jgi:hypothetical protein
MIDTSTLFGGAIIGEGTQVSRSVIGTDASIGAGSTISDAVIGDGADSGAGCELRHGARVWAGIDLPACGMRFSPYIWPLSDLVAGFRRNAGPGEINSVVADVPQKLDEIRTRAVDRGAEIDEPDDVTVSLADRRWFNVRPSNTKLLLRINVEAPKIDAMTSLRDEALALIRGESPRVRDGVSDT